MTAGLERGKLWIQTCLIPLKNWLCDISYSYEEDVYKYRRVCVYARKIQRRENQNFDILVLFDFSVLLIYLILQ